MDTLLAPALAKENEEEVDIEDDDDDDRACNDNELLGKDGGEAKSEIGFPSTLISLFLLCEINRGVDDELVERLLRTPPEEEEELRLVKLTPGMLIGLVVKCDALCDEKDDDDNDDDDDDCNCLLYCACCCF